MQRYNKPFIQPKIEEPNVAFHKVLNKLLKFQKLKKIKKLIVNEFIM